MTATFFGHHSTHDYQDVMQRTTERLGQLAADRVGVHADTSIATLRERVDAVDLDSPTGELDAALDEVFELYVNESVWFHHPHYLAHLNCPVLNTALVAEAITSAVNTSVDTWDQSRAATLIEARLLQQMASWAGMPASAEGVFTSGGTQSNQQALLLARGHAASQGGRRLGLGEIPADVLPKLRVFITDNTHFSIVKAAGISGLTHDAIVRIATDDDGRMDVDALETALTLTRHDGNIPMLVVATAGTTDRGAVDPLAAIGQLCDDHNVWFHVDAAVGGAMLTSPHLRHRIEGIARADSVTVDFHKSFFQPVACSALLVKDPADFAHIAVYADYLNPEECDYPNHVNRSLATTRRFDALKLWLTIRAHGVETIGELFGQCLTLAQTAYRQASESPFLEMLERPQLNTLLFRFVDADPLRREHRNRELRESLLRCGTVNIAATVIDGEYWLKMTFLNPTTTTEDLAQAFGKLQARWDALAPLEAFGAQAKEVLLVSA